VNEFRNKQLLIALFFIPSLSIEEKNDDDDDDDVDDVDEPFETKLRSQVSTADGSKEQ